MYIKCSIISKFREERIPSTITKKLHDLILQNEFDNKIYELHHSLKFKGYY